MTVNVILREIILLIQVVGSGKLSVPQILAVVNGGIIFIIENILVLSSDQISKIHANLNNNSIVRLILSFYLDIIKEMQD